VDADFGELFSISTLIKAEKLSYLQSQKHVYMKRMCFFLGLNLDRIRWTKQDPIFFFICAKQEQ